MESDLLFLRNEPCITRESCLLNMVTSLQSNEEFKNFAIKLDIQKISRLVLLVPVIKKYGIERTKCLLSSKIFNAEDENITKELISIFCLGMSESHDAVLKLISEMIEEGSINLKVIRYAFFMGYDYTFTINLILQFSYLLKVMCNYKIGKISLKVDYKKMYTFFREADAKIAEEAAILMERNDKKFFERLNKIEIKLAYII